MATFPACTVPLAHSARAGVAVSDAGVIGARNLVKMFYEFDVEAVSAVDVAQENNGEVALHVVFDLNQLLLIRSGVGRVSDGQVAGDLLLDGHARRRARFRGGASQKRIDAKMADAEKPFDPSSQSGRDRFGKQRRRTLAGAIGSTRRA